MTASLAWPAAAAWPADERSAPQSPRLTHCLLLALLLHVWLVALVGTAPGGPARPGEGAWSALEVRLGGPGPVESTGRADRELPYSGPAGRATELRYGGALHDAPVRPAPEPGAAELGLWAPTGRTPMAQPPSNLATPPGQASARPPLLERTDPGRPMLPRVAETAPQSVAPPAPSTAPQLAAQDALQAPALTPEAVTRRDPAFQAPAPSPVLRTDPAPAPQRDRAGPEPSPAPPAASPAALPAPGESSVTEPVPRAPVLRSAPARAATVRSVAPDTLDALRGASASLTAPPVQAPAHVQSPQAQPPNAALPHAQPPLPSIAPPVAPPTVTAAEPLPAAARPSTAAPAREAAAEPSAPVLAAPTPARPAEQAGAVAPSGDRPGGAVRAAPEAPGAAPGVAARDAGRDAARDTARDAARDAGRGAPPAGEALPRGGALDAVPRLGTDRAPPPADVAPRPLDLSLPRVRGAAPAEAQPRVLNLLPPPPERKSPLAEGIEKAARRDCRTAHASSGLLALAPLAADALSGKGCKW